MREIKCHQCGKHLFNTDKSDGAAGNDAIRMGFVFKLPILYGISGCFFFCSKECHQKWSKDSITEENILKGDKIISDMKAKEPGMIESTSKALLSFNNALNSLKRSKQ